MAASTEGPAGEARPSRSRGTPLVATLARAGAAAAILLGSYFALSRFLFEKLHVDTRGPGALWIDMMDGALLVSLLFVWLALRAEESRLARELRTARSGSPELRSLALRQRQKMPFLARFCATRLGTAAVLLADGEVDAARDELRANPLLARGGALDRLRAIVEADEARARGTAGGLERCIEALRALPPTGNREADLYRMHVLVKAILQKGDAARAQELCAELETSQDDDLRLYAVWLVVWFEAEEPTERGYREAAEPSAPLAEGDLRMAALLARAQGADALIERLEERLARAPIANDAPRE